VNSGGFQTLLEWGSIRNSRDSHWPTTAIGLPGDSTVCPDIRKRLLCRMKGGADLFAGHDVAQTIPAEAFIADPHGPPGRAKATSPRKNRRLFRGRYRLTTGFKAKRQSSAPATLPFGRRRGSRLPSWLKQNRGG
jgi:hypothetical protein